MGKPTGFLEIERQDRTYEPIEARLKTLERICPAAAGAWWSRRRLRAAWIAAFRSATRAARSTTRSRISTTWSIATNGRTVALDNLQSTNNFPEFTGRVRPARPARRPAR